MALSRTSADPRLHAAAASIVKSLGGDWKPSGAMCRCPAHDDHRPSLSVRVGEHSILFKCFAGCSTVDIIRALRGDRQRIPSTDSVATTSDGHERQLTGRIRALWKEANAIVDGAARAYLASRGLAARTQRFAIMIAFPTAVVRASDSGPRCSLPSKPIWASSPSNDYSSTLKPGSQSLTSNPRSGCWAAHLAAPSASARRPMSLDLRRAGRRHGPRTFCSAFRFGPRWGPIACPWSRYPSESNISFSSLTMIRRAAVAHGGLARRTRGPAS